MVFHTLTRRKKMAGTQVMIKTRHLPNFCSPCAPRREGLMSPMSRHPHKFKDLLIVSQPRRVRESLQRCWLEGHINWCLLYGCCRACDNATSMQQVTDPEVLAAASKCPYIQQVVVSQTCHICKMPLCDHTRHPPSP